MIDILEFIFKWGATLFALLGVYCTAYDITPHNKWFNLTSAVLWGLEGIIWNQPSMIILNVIIIVIYIKGLGK
jgi:hypothetical protein